MNTRARVREGRRPGEPSREPRWGLVDVAAGVVAFLLLSSLARLIVRQPGVIGEPLVVIGIEQVLGGWLPLFAVVLVASRWRGRGRLRDDFGLRMRPADLGTGLVAGVTLRLAAVGIAVLVRNATGTPATAFSGGVGDPVLFVLFGVLAVSVVSPVIEELYFRGLVLRSIERAVVGAGSPDAAIGASDAPAGALAPGSAARVAASASASASRQRRQVAAAVAVLGSALLFTAFHLDGVPETAAAASRLLSLFVVGLVLGALAVLTRRLGASIVAHAVFNLSVAVLELVTPPAAIG